MNPIFLITVICLAYDKKYMVVVDTSNTSTELEVFCPVILYINYVQLFI